MTLIKLPRSNEIIKVNEITLNYFLKVFDKEIGEEEFEFFKIELKRKIGHSTEIVKSRKIFLHRNSSIKEVDYYDKNIARIIRRISKRSNSEEITIKIFKNNKVIIEDY